MKIGDEYRLNESDLNRIVNSAGAANDLAWCVKDLMLAHYELDGLRDELAELNDAYKRGRLAHAKGVTRIRELEEALRGLLAEGPWPEDTQLYQRMQKLLTTSLSKAEAPVPLSRAEFCRLVEMWIDDLESVNDGQVHGDPGQTIKCVISNMRGNLAKWAEAQSPKEGL